MYGIHDMFSCSLSINYTFEMTGEYIKLSVVCSVWILEGELQVLFIDLLILLLLIKVFDINGVVLLFGVPMVIGKGMCAFCL